MFVAAPKTQHATWDGGTPAFHGLRRGDEYRYAADDVVIPAQRAAEYLRAIRKRWRLVAAVASLAVAGALAFSMATTKKYDASASIVFSRSNLVSTLFQTSSGQSLDPERDVNTSLKLVTSDPVAQRVLAQVRPPMTMLQLLAEVSVSAVGNSNIVAITARDPRPSRATTIANAFARQYVEYDANVTRGQYVDGAEALSRKLDSMTPADRASREGRALADRVQQMEIAADVSSGSARLLGLATTPTSAAVPRTKFDVVIALMVGLFLGSLLAIGLARRD